MATYVGPHSSPGLVGLAQPSLSLAPAGKQARARPTGRADGKKGIWLIYENLSYNWQTLQPACVFVVSKHNGTDSLAIWIQFVFNAATFEKPIQYSTATSKRFVSHCERVGLHRPPPGQLGALSWKNIMPKWHDIDTWRLEYEKIIINSSKVDW